MAKKATYIQAKVSGGSTVESFEIVDKAARENVSSLAGRVATLEAQPAPDSITVATDSQTGVVTIEKNGSGLVNVIPAENAATAAALSTVQQSVAEINENVAALENAETIDSTARSGVNTLSGEVSALSTVVAGHTGVINIVSENIADLRYKEDLFTAIQTNQNTKIGSDGEDEPVYGYYVKIFDVRLYRGEKVRITTTDESNLIHYAFYNAIGASEYATMSSDALISASEDTDGPLTNVVVDVPVTASALAVGTTSAAVKEMVVYGLIDRIARNEKYLANVAQIINGTYANFKDAFESLLEVNRDTLAYVNTNYPNKYQTYHYIGMGEAGKSYISNWRPDEGNDTKDYTIVSTTYTSETVNGKSGKIWTYTIPVENVIRNAYVPGSYYAGTTQCFDKADRIMYSFSTTQNYYRTLPPFTAKITVATRNDEWKADNHYITINSEVVPQTLNDYINEKCTITVGSDGTTTLNTQNKALAIPCAPVEGGKDYILATVGNKSAYESTRRIMFLDSSFVLIGETYVAGDYSVGVANNHYNNVLRITSPANAAYAYFPVKFTSEGVETVSEALLCYAEDFTLATCVINNREANERHKQVNNLNIGILGDSTSSTAFGKSIKAYSQSGNCGAWVAFFNTLIKPKEVRNNAAGGATVRDTTPISNGVITTTANTYIKQIESMISHAEQFTPDYIFVVGCTNDESTSSPYAWVTDAELNGTDYDTYMEQTFMTSSNNVIDINNVDCSKLAGALRYIVQRAFETWPNVRMIVCTPLRNNYTNQANQRACVRDMKWMAKRLSLPIIDVFEEANMPFLWDDASGKRHWLYDAYHPYKQSELKQGAARHGRFIAKKFLQILDYETDYDITFSKVNVSVSNSTEYTVDYPTTACTTDTIAIYVNAANASITVTATDADDNAVSCEQSAIGETSTKVLVYVPATDLTVTISEV